MNVEALDVECEINSVTPDKQSMSAQELTTADEVTLYINLGNQTDKAGFAQQIRTLFDSIDPEQYPNLSARVFADYEGGAVHRLPQRPLFDAAGRERSAEPD